MAGLLEAERERAALALQALQQDAGLKKRLKGLIRQTYAAGLAEGDPLCRALADSLAARVGEGEAQRRLAARVIYLNPAWSAWKTPRWSALRRLSYTVFGPRKGAARRVLGHRVKYLTSMGAL